MRVANGTLVMALGTLACLSGCASHPPPRAWRLSAVAVQHSPRGGWIRIEFVAPTGPGVAKSSTRSVVDGELIAVDRTTLYVLTMAGLQPVPLATSVRITLVGYQPSTGALTAWAVAGGISAWSHGTFLFFTAPMWAISGIAAHHSEKQAGTTHDVERARAFARFPQGLPPGFDPKSLEIRR